MLKNTPRSQKRSTYKSHAVSFFLNAERSYFSHKRVQELELFARNWHKILIPVSSTIVLHSGYTDGKLYIYVTIVSTEGFIRTGSMPNGYGVPL